MEKIKNPWQKIILDARPVEEEDDQLDDNGSDSSDETNQEIDSDDDFDFSNCDTSERSKLSVGICGQNMWMCTWR